VTTESRIAQLAEARRKYRWTPELRELLREVYRGRNKRALTAGIDKLCSITGWKRWAVIDEAIRLGITTSDHRRIWAAAEIAYLEERASAKSASNIARAMGRSIASVKGRARKLELSLRLREGYTLADLQRVFGVSDGRAAGWVRRGLFGHAQRAAGVRVSEASVARFLRKFPGEYELRRVDEDWYKAMLFGRLAGRAM